MWSHSPHARPHHHHLPCTCDDGAVPWVRDIFADCLYSWKDRLAFGLGLLSIFCWVQAQLPQIYSNYVNKSTEALSFFFLVSTYGCAASHGAASKLRDTWQRDGGLTRTSHSPAASMVPRRRLQLRRLVSFM